MFKFVALSVLLGVCSAGSYHGYHDYHSIELPVKSYSSREVIHSESHRDEPQTYADIPGGVMPVYLTFKTKSSPVYVKQHHKGTKGSYQKSDSHDEAHVLVHEVIKPVIQELKEIIEPYRKVVQVIKPVKEEVMTKVHKNEGHHKHHGYGDDGDDGHDYHKSYKNDDKYGKYGKNDDQNDGKYDDKYEKYDMDEYKKYMSDNYGYSS